MIGLLGAGASAREMASYLPPGGVAFRAVGRDFLLDPELMIDIDSPTPEQAALPVLATPGAPGLRRAMVSRWSGSTYATVLSPHAYLDGSLRSGSGTVVAPSAVVTTDVSLGQHCQINIGASLSHDCVLGDYVTLAPGARLAGGVDVGDGVFLGIGSVVSQGVRIAAGSVIGAGAVVLNDIGEPNSVMVGVPARCTGRRDGWLDAL